MSLVGILKTFKRYLIVNSKVFGNLIILSLCEVFIIPGSMNGSSRIVIIIVSFMR